MSASHIPEPERRQLLIASMEYAAALNRVELHGPNEVLRAALDKAAVDLDQAAHAFCHELDFAKLQAASDTFDAAP